MNTPLNSNALWLRLRTPLLALLALGLLALLIWNLLAMSHTSNPKADLPRFTELPAFDPYRKTFTCRHEAQANPVPSEQAQSLFEEAMALDEYSLDPREIDYKKVASLYHQAMTQGHWKAQFNLAGLYLEGKGVPFDPNEALRLTEDLMTKGVPAAWFNMGNYYMSGVGPLKQDATVAYAFWQRAADMGSLHAQALLGDALDADVNEPPKWWANRAIGRQMLECAFAQGSGEAAYRLGLSYEAEVKDLSDRNARQALATKALQRYHEGVKFGSQECANSAFAEFHSGSEVVGNIKDPFRARRYHEISEYLRHHPDTRLPNLDRVLPLPPAKLPTWDGEVESLIGAAKPVRAAPAAGKGSSAQGRARVPDGHALVAPKHPEPPMHATEFTPQGTVLARAPQAGYYQPLHRSAVEAPADTSHLPERLRHPVEHTTQRLQREALQEAPPLAFQAGEVLSLARSGVVSLVANFADTAEDHALVHWRFVGTAQATRPVSDHLAKAGLVHAIVQATATRCADGAACPQSGIWQFEVANADHPLAKVFNASLAGESWRRQAFVREGQSLPKFAQELGPALSKDEAAQLKLQWRLMVACETGFEPATVAS